MKSVIPPGGKVTTSRIGFELPSELRDVNPEVVCLLGLLWAPDLLQQLLLSHNLSCMANEGRQQPVLDWREVDLFPCNDNSPERDVHMKVTHGERRIGTLSRGARRVAQDHPHARE